MATKKPMAFSLSENTITSINTFAELVGLSKSDIVTRAISNYIMGKDEFRYSEKLRKCFTDEQIKVYEQANGEIKPFNMQTVFDASKIVEK